MTPEERHWRNVGFILAGLMFALAITLFAL